LIELLVVIAIVGLLVGLLLPVLSGARASGRTIKCAAQLQSISSLTASFAVDRKEQAPIAGRLWQHPTAQFGPAYLPRGLLYYFEAGAGSLQRPLPFFASIAAHAGLELDLTSRDILRGQLGFPGSSPGASGGFFRYTRCPDDATFNPEDLNHLGNSLLPEDLSWTVGTGLGEMSSYMLNEWALGESYGPSTRLLGKLYKSKNPSMVAYVADGEPRVFEPPLGMNYMLFFDEETQPGYTFADYNAWYRGASPQNQFARGVFYQFGFPVDYETGAVRGAARHRAAMNVTFIDGHVSTVPLNERALRGVFISDP